MKLRYITLLFLIAIIVAMVYATVEGIEFSVVVATIMLVGLGIMNYLLWFKLPR